MEYLFSIPRFTGKNTMEDTEAFLHRLGDPDRKMKIIHVAGTNGKGSVCAYLRSILEAAGYTVNVFTSPHLVDVRERFLIHGEMVSREEFLRAFHAVCDRLDRAEPGQSAGYHPSFFEFIFFIGMILFDSHPADYCILETGLGGRLDATNSVSQKELSVITHISLDHVAYLGDTVEQIASEKAGIMKTGAKCVYWCTSPGISEVFEKRALELGVKTQPVSKEHYRFLGIQNKSIDFSMRTRYYKDIELRIRTIAPYQMENAALAVRAIEAIDEGKSITALHIRQGVASCFWAGRMEEVLPEVFVDGAHNEDGIRAFLDAVRADGFEGRRALMFAVVSDKDYGRMIAQVVESGLFERFYLTQLHTGRTVPGEVLEAVFAQYPACRFESFDNVSAAFEALLHSRKSDERCYIAGSLYLVGEIKELLR